MAPASIRAALGLALHSCFGGSRCAFPGRSNGGNSPRRRISGKALRRFGFLSSLPMYGLGDHSAAMPQNTWKMVKFTI
jgi:hypothetical protein